MTLIAFLIFPAELPLMLCERKPPSFQRLIPASKHCNNRQKTKIQNNLE
jgi:hypothetical protein